jgi:potassium-dependent mechanosensitive channel
MNKRPLLSLMLLIALFWLFLPLRGQIDLQNSKQEEAPRSASDTVVLKPYSPAEITEAFNSTNSQINTALKKHLSPQTRKLYSSQIDTLLAGINRFLNDSSLVDLGGKSSRELDQVNQRALFYLDKMKGQQERLSRIALDIQGETELLQGTLRRWQLSLKQGGELQMMELRVKRIEASVQRIDSVRNLLLSDLVFMVGQQDHLASRKTDLQELLSRVKEQNILLGVTILSRDEPGFFRALGGMKDSRLLQSHVQSFLEALRTDQSLLKSGYTSSLVFAFLLLLALMVFSVWFKKHHVRLIPDEGYAKLPQEQQIIVKSPLVTALFLFTLMVRLLLNDLPQTFASINLLVLTTALAILMIRIYGSLYRTWIAVLMIAISLNVAYELFYHPGALLRILLMALSFVGIWLFTWIYKRKALGKLIKHQAVQQALQVLVLVFLALQFLAIIANLLGAFRLTEFFVLMPIQITLLAMAIQLTTKLAQCILFLTLSSNKLQKLHVVKEDFQLIYKKSIWLIDLLLLLLFISISFKILRIKDVVFDWGRGVLMDGIKIGAIDISLGSVLIFFFVIWLSIVISRTISRVLEKDVFTRVKTAKGIPGTITLLLRIGLITGGFFFAAAASGMQLTNLSIVLGAFSVGIGFGLQNIFNNMVSGLILAFERPINVGDVVQVGELMGTVRSIGLRSSTVRSFDGAEVIVPNGNLISNEMINWTLSDSNRRMDIRVGVAYGTDPQRVLDLMEEVAKAHKLVGNDPKARAYFVEFGDSSLNFRLLAWVILDNRLEVESELLVQINNKLVEAGIEIPFPQRDLHIRSDATRPETVPETKRRAGDGGTKK